MIRKKFIIAASLVLAVAHASGASAIGSPEKPGIQVAGTTGQRFASVQAAVAALPVDGGIVIIPPGVYREKITIKGARVHLRGTGRKPEDTVIVYGDSAATAGGTFKSATVSVSGDDFRATNLTIRNDYGADLANSPSQAVALSLTGDRSVIRKVRLLGHQDTLFANRGPNLRPSRQYFVDCYIEGHVDFIFGDAKAYFDRCRIHGVAYGSVMYTAQSRRSATDDSAYVFDRCTFTADPAVAEVSLGRAWRPYARVILIDAKLDASIIPEGWREWTPGKTSTLPTAWYAEYRSTGRGASPATREPYSRQLTSQEVAPWRLPGFFGSLDWIR
jgi:pectinesterase